MNCEPWKLLKIFIRFVEDVGDNARKQPNYYDNKWDKKEKKSEAQRLKNNIQKILALNE